MSRKIGSAAPELFGRTRECKALDRLVTTALGGTSQVLVLRGDAGVGKSALLGYLSGKVDDWHVASAVGVESSMELAYSGLYQLCAPMLDHIERLPAPQRDALATVFGLSAGPPPDRFLVGLATLTLFAEVAEDRPLICIVDDVQWLDQASAQILAFVTRRLLAERIAIVCVARRGIGDQVLAGLPELPVGGLDDSDSRALLLSNIRGPVDIDLSHRIIAESQGNPLALIELPRAWKDGDLAGGFGLPDNQPIGNKIEESYAQRASSLPADTRLLMLTAAAESVGDTALLHRAATMLDLDIAALAPATDAGLVRLDGRVQFTHPLARTAVYRSAAPEDRRRVHGVLAGVTDATTDPDRRAWHRAGAASGPDEQVATELEQAAERARARGGLAAVAALLQRAVGLSGDPARRTERALVAARASLDAGRFDAARRILSVAEVGTLDEYQHAQVDILHGQLAMFTTMTGDAAASLLKAAQRLETVDAGLARETYLDAWSAAFVAGHGSAGDDRLAVSRAARAAPYPDKAARPVDLLLDSLATLTIDGPRAAAPQLQQAVAAFTDEACPHEEIIRWNWLAVLAAWTIWDDESVYTLRARTLKISRDSGALARLQVELGVFAQAGVRCGDFADVAQAIAEIDAAGDGAKPITGSYVSMRLAASRGREAEARAVIEAVLTEATAAGQGTVTERCNFSRAVLCNGLGQYEEALVAARAAVEYHPRMYLSAWAAVELLEAATRAGRTAVAEDALHHVLEATAHLPNDAAQGIAARSRALMTTGERADGLYRDAIERLGRSLLRPELARAHLLYGEWLRREGRQLAARGHLHDAHEQFTAIGMEAFAERARAELAATGETVRKRSDDTRTQLTPQELQIARMAREGLSNPEIGARLFLSPRTVEWHLRKVFGVLSISSRRQLRTNLPELDTGLVKE
ncbi:AAA family ATPase [Amycolatopsis sp. NPDC051716]|uniref:helix-turn-helix transcriptional regulator n=1 Tax=Amycolatopsis sp. NPDC051716 TaxID=3155804 RepID=UPI00341C0B7C